MPAGPHVRLVDRQVVAGGEQVSGCEAGDPGSDNGELHTPVLTKRSPIWLNERVLLLSVAASLQPDYPHQVDSRVWGERVAALS